MWSEAGLVYFVHISIWKTRYKDAVFAPEKAEAERQLAGCGGPFRYWATRPQPRTFLGL